MLTDKTGKEKDGGTTTPGTEGLSRTSAAEQLTSLFEEGKQYAGKDVVAAVGKVIEDTLSADGREQKDRAVKAEGEVTRLTGELNGLTTKFDTLSGQMVDITRTQNEAALSEVKEDPTALASLRVRQANAAEEIRLKGERTSIIADKAALVTERADFAKKETGFSIKLAAMASGVDEVALAARVPDGDPTRLGLAANDLKAQTAVVIDPVTKLSKPPGLTNTPAALVSTSGDARSVSEKMLADAKAK